MVLTIERAGAVGSEAGAQILSGTFAVSVEPPVLKTARRSRPARPLRPFWIATALAGVIMSALLMPSIAAASTTAVSCVSASFCAVVDDQGRTATFDGTSWSPGKTIDSNALTSISCASPSFCVAADYAGNVLTFTSGSWSAPVGIGVGYPPLLSVSCPTETFCVAVDRGTGAFLFDGSSWTSTSPDSGLRAVSCTPSRFCAEVNFFGRAATFDGSSWSVPVLMDSFLNPATGVTTYLALRSVSCPSARFCVAVDEMGNTATFNGNLEPPGNGWSHPHNIDAGDLRSVSCASSSLCFAVDASGNALIFDGTSWTKRNIDGTTPLVSVSCPTVLFCMAIDNNYQSFTFTFSAPAPPAAPLQAPVGTSPPTISGLATQNQTLTEGHGAWSNSPASYGYQWQRCNAAGSGCVAIAGATGQTYPLTSADVAHTIRVQETASNHAGGSAPATSAATAVVQPVPTGGGAGGGTSAVGGSGTMTVGTVKASGTTASVVIGCEGATGVGCVAKLSLTVTETVRGGKMIAVSAAENGRTQKKVVVLGNTTVTLAANQRRTVRVSLNATGKRLLSTRRSLKVKLTITRTVDHKAKVVSVKTVAFKAKPNHKP